MKFPLLNLPHSIVNYLNKYGTDRWSVNLFKNRLFDNIIVIPAIAEYENITKLYESLRDNDDKYFNNTLLLFVINCSESATEEVKQNNYNTIDLLEKLMRSSELNIGYVNASSTGFYLPEKDAGVGYARKIGMDLALSLFDYKTPNKKILICLDADCEVEPNYLTTIIDSFNNKKINAAVIEYEHKLPESDFDKSAIICYELFLRYYVLGLKYAKSPYAFHTVGSTMVCDSDSYIKIGGMNKRKAAEDFYFLEKLAKVVDVHKISETKVFPSSRTSWRVPFGTGQRMNRFKAGTHNEYLLYDPQVFVILAEWNRLFLSEDILKSKEYLSLTQNEVLIKFLEMNSFEEQWNSILENAKTKSQIQKQKKIWFDGFRTLKMIHFLRDNGYPNINMFSAIDKFFDLIKFPNEIKRKEDIPPVAVQLEYLHQIKSAEHLLTGLN